MKNKNKLATELERKN